jgi:hypothetical protein
VRKLSPRSSVLGTGIVRIDHQGALTSTSELSHRVGRRDCILEIHSYRWTPDKLNDVVTPEPHVKLRMGDLAALIGHEMAPCGK